jgi:hypothetical protein
MILDSLLMFSTPASPQAITTTAASTNIIDLLNPRDMGIGDNPALKVACIVTTAFTAAGAGTLTVSFQGAPDNGSGAPGTYVDYAISRAYALADLVVGAKLLPIDVPHRDPSLLVTFPRFYRLNYTVATGPMTAGAIVAGIVIDRQDSAIYPAGLTITN